MFIYLFLIIYINLFKSTNHSEEAYKNMVYNEV